MSDQAAVFAGLHPNAFIAAVSVCLDSSSRPKGSTFGAVADRGSRS
jgi:hypothetical protein